MTPVLDLLADLVRFPSLTGEEGPIASFVEGRLRDAGLAVGRHANNVYAWLDEGDDTLLLNSHLDVVPPSEGHPYAPFTPTLVDGKLFGRGAVDAKASGAAMLTALTTLAAEGWRPEGGRLMVALTAAEEGCGGYNGLEDLRPHLPPIRAALVGEPTGLQPCVAQKGLLVLRLHARGRTAHAARAHLGDNAIRRALRDVDALDRLHFDRADPFLGTPTVNVTRIEGGTKSNVIPDCCTLTLDVRSTPAYTHDELIALIDAAVESDVEVHSKRLIPVATAPTERIVWACRQALPDAAPFGSPTASDWIFLADVPTVKIGPGESPLSHTPDEHVPVADVERAVAVYRAIARAYFTPSDAS